jgi:hypothetical protein
MLVLLAVSATQSHCSINAQVRASTSPNEDSGTGFACTLDRPEPFSLVLFDIEGVKLFC